MMQLSLFDDLQPEPEAATAAPDGPVLIGFYYERSTDKFVSFARGARHYEVPAKECEFTKEWQKQIKLERAI